MTRQPSDDNEEYLSPLEKLWGKDVKAAAVMLTPGEVRFLVDYYYQIQDYRIQTAGQLRQGEGEPNQVLQYLYSETARVEQRIKIALDVYTKSKEIGRWAQSVYGIGPVITAGLMAHIDITRADTAGAVWRYAGLDPTNQWIGRKGAEEMVKRFEAAGIKDLDELLRVCAAEWGHDAEWIRRTATTDPKGNPRKLSRAGIVAAMAKRPWNARLKVLCWKAGQSFMKFSGRDECYYGKVYKDRKALEISRNENLQFADQAASILASRNIGKDTDAYASYSVGKLPPAQIDARARRST